MKRVDLFNSEPLSLRLSGCESAASISWLISKKAQSCAQVVVLETQKDMTIFANALSVFNSQLNVYMLTGFDVLLTSGLAPSPCFERLEWLHQAKNPSKNKVFLSCVKALSQKTLASENLPLLTLKKQGRFLQENFRLLKNWGYQNVEHVEEKGSFSEQGHTIDIFSPNLTHPVRLDLFADEIENMFLVCPKNGRKIQNLEKVNLLPASEIQYEASKGTYYIENYEKFCAGTSAEADEILLIKKRLAARQFFSELPFLLPCFHKDLVSPLSYFNNQKIQIWNFYPHLSSIFKENMDSYQEDYEKSLLNAINPNPQSLFEEPNLSQNKCIHISDLQLSNQNKDLQVSTYFSHSLEKDFHRSYVNHKRSEKKKFLKRKFSDWIEKDIDIFLFSPNKTQFLEFCFLLRDLGFKILEKDSYEELLFLSESSGKIYVFNQAFPSSFHLQKERKVFLSMLVSDKKKLQSREKLHNSFKALSFSSLDEGDYVIHINHGLSLYRGLHQIKIGNMDSEFVKLEYKGKDYLYVPAYKVNEMQKYVGAVGTLPLNKLGTERWQDQIKQTKNKIKDIAADLISLYAQRTSVKKVPIQTTGEYQNFLTSLPFTPTPDQQSSINDVIADLEKNYPMDRLICGDVGFGKTEVALHAIFLAVKSGRQVALLAPTTVLSFQHQKTLQKRLDRWGIQVEVWNRFIDKAKEKKILKQVKSGEIHVLVGTHKLLSKKLEYKNLGFLIIDEEQKFGVQQKEQLKSKKVNLDTLTLTATPIPRSLNMSLLGIRDLSIIQTAPKNRIPTKIFITRFEKKTIRMALLEESRRGGQSFFICPKIQDLLKVFNEIEKLVPELKVSWAHGAMPESEFESRVMNFYSKKTDVLVATTIMESGVDIPSANTIFIYKAAHFGLPQIYQLKGRVGRSHQKSYCYLLVDPEQKLTLEQQEKLKAVQIYNGLGQGLQISHKDLDLRGPGNIIGEEQSGFSTTVGFEMYMDLLNEEIQQQKNSPKPSKQTIQPDIQINFPAFLPSNYVFNLKLRLAYYKQLSECQNVSSVGDIESNLIEQFGPLPSEAQGLLNLITIRIKCEKLHISSLSSTKKGISINLEESTPINLDSLIKKSLDRKSPFTLRPNNKIYIPHQDNNNDSSWEEIYKFLEILIDLT